MLRCPHCGSERVEYEDGVGICRNCGGWWGGRSLPYDGSPDHRLCLKINRGEMVVSDSALRGSSRK